MVALSDIRELLDETLQLGGRGLQLQPESDLFGALPELDSMAVVAVLTEIERRWELVIDDAEIDAEAFATLGALQSFIARQLAGASAATVSGGGG